MDTQEFDVGKSLFFGVNYAARRLEEWTFAEDLDAGEAEQVGGENDERWLNWIDQGRDLRREVQKALFEAQSGDYLVLKQYLMREGIRRQSQLNGIGAKLQTLSQLIPEKGEPIKLPIPAWLDPRFNPEASPLPLNVDKPKG